MPKTFTNRSGIIYGFFILIIIIFVSKLYVMQVANGAYFKDKADRQYKRPQSTFFDRGTIYATTKDKEEVALASVRSGYILAINPSEISNPKHVFTHLSEIVELDEEEFIRKASLVDDPYEEVALKLDKDQKDAIEELGFEGVYTYSHRWRYYPGDSLATSTVGFVSYGGDGQTLQGQYGLERQFEEILSRSNDDAYANFFVEIFSGITDSLSGKEKEGSLITTLEPKVQAEVENTMTSLQDDFNPEQTGVIIMNPNTGAIYAIGSYPTFDPNFFTDVESVSVFSNPLVESVYEMGSVVKPVTVAVGLDTKTIEPDSTYEDKGSITLNNATFYNYDKKARGIVDMQEVLNQSLNTGVAHVASEVGYETFGQYFRDIFGDKTEIELPNEAAPLVSNIEDGEDIEYATASFGQGIAVSPISMVKALATLGNGGHLVSPHIVSEIDYVVGVNKKVGDKESARIFSENTSKEISRMLTAVVDEALANGEYAKDDYAIAAKTGTAQIAREDGGGYYEDKFLHSFFGYFPAYDPEFIIFLYAVDPKGVTYASETLTKPFFRLTDFLINYYDIPPDR